MSVLQQNFFGSLPVNLWILFALQHRFILKNANGIYIVADFSLIDEAYTNIHLVLYYTEDSKRYFDHYFLFEYRNHAHDLENIPVFVLVGFFYVLCGPHPWIALWHFRYN